MRALLLALILPACATGPVVTWDRLSDDEAAWSRCQQTIADHLCGGPITNSGDHRGRAACVLRFMDDLHAQTTYQTRRAWLLANGCPARLVTPEQITVDRWEAAAAPRATAPTTATPR